MDPELAGSALGSVQGSVADTLATHPTINPDGFVAQSTMSGVGTDTPAPVATMPGVQAAPGTPGQDAIDAKAAFAAANTPPLPPLGTFQSAMAAADAKTDAANQQEDKKTEETAKKKAAQVQAMRSGTNDLMKPAPAFNVQMPQRVQLTPLPVYQVSDQTAKQHITSPSSQQMDELMNNISPYSWDYKNPDKHGEGRFTGVMAQDLQKSEIGRQMVQPAEDGTLMVDTKRMAATAIAASALTYKENQQLKKIINNLNTKFRAK